MNQNVKPGGGAICAKFTDSPLLNFSSLSRSSESLSPFFCPPSRPLAKRQGECSARIISSSTRWRCITILTLRKCFRPLSVLIEIVVTVETSMLPFFLLLSLCQFLNPIPAVVQAAFPEQVGGPGGIAENLGDRTFPLFNVPPMAIREVLIQTVILISTQADAIM